MNATGVKLSCRDLVGASHNGQATGIRSGAPTLTQTLNKKIIDSSLVTSIFLKGIWSKIH
jgi:hypothetical protein